MNGRKFLLLSFLFMSGSLMAGEAPPREIQGVRWKLTEVMGKPVTAAKDGKAAFLLFTTDGKLQGFGGCNRLSGSYELSEGNRIHFGQIAATMMACPDMETEAALLSVLQSVDNYAILENTLSLNKARMAPLAKFEADCDQP